MIDKEVAEPVGGLKKLVPTGTCVLIEGLLAETPEGTKQVCAANPAEQHTVRITQGSSSSSECRLRTLAA